MEVDPRQDILSELVSQYAADCDASIRNFYTALFKQVFPYVAAFNASIRDFYGALLKELIEIHEQNISRIYGQEEE